MNYVAQLKMLGGLTVPLAMTFFGYKYAVFYGKFEKNSKNLLQSKLDTELSSSTRFRELDLNATEKAGMFSCHGSRDLSSMMSDLTLLQLNQLLDLWVCNNSNRFNIFRLADG